MSGRPYVIAETTWKTVKETKYELAILPWGATEAHNYHLPYATDVMEADYIAQESARKAWEDGAKVAALPTIPFGVNTGQLDIPFCINMNPSTQLALLRDVLRSLSSQSIKKFVILNSHGGNDFKQMIRELAPEFPDMFLCTINWYQILDQQKYFEHPDDHGGEAETSIMMHIQPELVLPLTEAGSGKGIPFALKGLRNKVAWTQRDWRKATLDTGVGDPSAATPMKGLIFLEDITRKIADFLVELAQADLDNLYLSRDDH